MARKPNEEPQSHSDGPPPPPDVPTTRAYQQEMLSESMHRNIIIALDTGSGKTLIAVLRIKHELEREPTKISWFFAPTVALCEQQKAYIEKYIPVSVGIVSGANEPDQWKNASLWERVIRSHRIMVSTPQVFLDALRHGYISLGRDISLLVFDEAHHALDKHPYNRIMVEFYFQLPTRTPQNTSEIVRPTVLGLTASPIYGGDVEKAFRTIESNLDSTIRSPRTHRSELALHVHRPTFRHITYAPLDDAFSANLAALNAVIETLNIEEDPYTISLRKQLTKHPVGTPEHTRIDQRLSKVVQKENSFTHKGLRDFARAAYDICADIGPWAADWFVHTVLQRAMAAADPYNNIMASWRNTEKKYLLDRLGRVAAVPVSMLAEDVAAGLSPKTQALVACLVAQKAETEGLDDAFSCITFVQRRDSVLALAEVLKHHADTKDVFRIGTLLGSSDSSHRHSMMDITRAMVRESQDDTLDEFRSGERNLIISTSVAEEGIDIQACGSVIRWDPPPNMASWAQSRGRARKKRSTFTLMFEDGGAAQADIDKWEEQERRMVELYNDPSRDLALLEEDPTDEGPDDDDDDLFFTVPSTGATLTLHSAVTHLTHFCAVIPNSSHVDNRPLYDLDPPEFPPGWHAFTAPLEPYTGPYGSRVTLPRALPLPQRTFSVPMIYSNKISAHRHAAYMAYMALWDNGLLNDHLLPITSIIEPELEEEVRDMMKDVEKRASVAKVSLGIDPWAPVADEDAMDVAADDDELKGAGIWYCSELRIGDLPTLFFFAQTELLAEHAENGPVLYQPGVPPIKTSLSYMGPLSGDGTTIARAREYTRLLLWGLNHSRMDWADRNFAYLFLPADAPNTEWDVRREWCAEVCARPGFPHHVAPARDFGETFRYPTDTTLVQKYAGYGKPFKFVRWRHGDEPLTEEEASEVGHTYQRKDEEVALDVIYPVLVVEAFPPRSNFLIPIKPKPLPVEGDVDNIPEQPHQFIFLPEKSGVILLSPEEAGYAFLLPSVLRSLSMSLTAHSLRRSLFAGTLLHDISIPLLTVAITAPSSGEKHNYQRLETLGDTVLKFVAGLQLLSEYPLWHEGYLTRKKDHAVSNVRLAKENIKRAMYRWVIRDNMLGKKWKPRYFTVQSPPETGPASPAPELQEASVTPVIDVLQESVSEPKVDAQLPLSLSVDTVILPLQSLILNSQEIEPTDTLDITAENTDIVKPSTVDSAEVVVEEPVKDKAKDKKKKKNKKNSQLSTKVLADVIESTVGAAYLHGGLDLGYECLKFFDLGLKWAPLQERVAQVLSRVDASLPGVDEPAMHFPRQLDDVERMLGYTFKRKILLIEALTHASYQNETRTPSYERMEFLGDSVLDMIITNFLYHAPGKDYSPGHMHLRKSAVVNAHILAFICLKTSITVNASMPHPRKEGGQIELVEQESVIHLWQCLLHSSQFVLDDQLNTVRRFKKRQAEIDTKLATSPMFPWAALTRLHAPKFLSDMVESIIGAIFLDSQGSMDTVREVLEGLGIMPLIARIVKDDVDVLHPVSRLAMWASKHEKKIEYKINRSKGQVSCAVVVDDKEETFVEEPWRGKASQEEVRYAAAEAAIEAFKLRASGSNWELLKKKKIPKPKNRKL